MNEEQREDALEYRRLHRFPRHTPPHFDFEGEHRYILTAACYEHAHVIGYSPNRMTDFEVEVLSVCKKFCSAIYAWCILPNHYHLLLRTAKIRVLRKEIGMLHGRSSFEWNGEKDIRGRQVWHNCFERRMKSERHYYASLNYILNNPVHHGYVKNWHEWQWSNAKEYLEKMGNKEVARIWREFPILDYGKKWDIF